MSKKKDSGVKATWQGSGSGTGKKGTSRVTLHVEGKSGECCLTPKTGELPKKVTRKKARKKISKFFKELTGNEPMSFNVRMNAHVIVLTFETGALPGEKKELLLSFMDKKFAD